MSSYARAVERFPSERIEQLAPRVERWLVAAVVLVYGLADVVTSIISMELGGYEATMFLNQWLHEFGYAALVANKIGVLTIIGAFLLIQTAIARSLNIRPGLFRSTILTMFAARGALLVGWNCYIIYLLVAHDVPPLVESPF